MRLLPLTAAALALLACSPGGSPTPEAGGQTGDPGVADFESLDPGTSPLPGGLGGSGGSCSPAVMVMKPDSVVDIPQRHQLAKLDDAHLLLLDDARGLAVIDTTAAPPHVVGRLPLPRSAGQLHVRGGHAFVVRRNVRSVLSFYENGFAPISDEAELLAIDLTDPAAPKIVSRLALERAARTSVLTESAGVTRIMVVSDDGAADGCQGPKIAVRVTSFSWVDGRFEQRAVLTLDEDIASRGIMVAPLRDKLLVLRGAQLSVVWLSTADGSLHESQQISASPPAALHEDEDGSVRTIGSSALEVLDLSDPSSPKRKAHCALREPFNGGSLITFSQRRVFSRGGSRDGTNVVQSFAFNPDGSCDLRSHQGIGIRDIRPVGALAPGRVLDIDRKQRGELRVRLLDEADLHVISELTIPGYQAGLDAARPLPDGTGTALWLQVYDDTGEMRTPRLQLLELSQDTLRAHGSVAAISQALPVATQQTLVWSEGRLAAIDLSNRAQPQLSAALDVSPNFSRVLAVDGHWARLRGMPGDYYRSELTGEELFASGAKGSLELVPIDQDPDLAGELGRVEANPFGRLIRVGSLLVSMARAYHYQVGPPRDRGPVPTLFEVFDVSDPLKPRRTGELRIDGLSLPEPCSTCTGSALDTRDMVVPGGLVLRAYAEDGRPALRVLDLSDPTRPQLSDAIPRPENEAFLAAFSDGSSVFYSYRVRAADVSSGGRARFYYRRIDFSDVQAPKVGAAISVPGQLVAIGDGALYTREFVSGGSTSIHRLSLKDGKARIEATYAVGSRAALRIELNSAGHLLLDLQPQPPNPGDGTWRPLPDMRVLDAITLEQLGETRVGVGSARLGVEGNWALYGAALGVVMVNLADPAAPRAQAYIPIFGVNFELGQGIVTNNAFVIEDSGALKRYSLDFANLP